MYEVSQNIDLSVKVDALFKKFDQLLALNTMPANSPNVQGVCAICSNPSHVIYDCPSTSLFPEFVQEQVNSAQGFHRKNDLYSNTYNPGGNKEGKLESQIRQLANAISRRDEGKLPSHPIENPRANYHEQAKVVITLRNGKLADNNVGEPIKDSNSNENETEGIDMETKIEKEIEKELISSSNSKTLESSPTASYKPKAETKAATQQLRQPQFEAAVRRTAEAEIEAEIGAEILQQLKQSAACSAEILQLLRRSSRNQKQLKPNCHRLVAVVAGFDVQVEEISLASIRNYRNLHRRHACYVTKRVVVVAHRVLGPPFRIFHKLEIISNLVAIPVAVSAHQA
ncbi:hypothetical protein M9H77_17036 [Catharanthus roseus]|uniref:Uncharacterized protein n=1 Tax=Catharanthus roseus TaxID=4058 RepID=A0ACC0B3H4_CATRO|nr:hypothetical protein M9H77_17036 [Catharanthus roseus]